MDYNVWRIEWDDSEVLWDGPLSQEDAEKVRFTRQRDEEYEHHRKKARFEVRPSYYEPLRPIHPCPGVDHE